MNKRLQYDVPEDWGNDEISKFLNAARQNQVATFAKYPQAVKRLAGIDAAFRRCVEAQSCSGHWFDGVFVLRGHSNYLGACGLVWSCQIPESFALLRSTLESALYGLYLSQNPEFITTWLERHDTKESKEKVRREFRIGALLKLVSDLNAEDGARVRDLYEITIDQGGHPNERAFTQYMDFSHMQSGPSVTMNYLTPGGVQLEMGLKVTAQVGVSALTLFERVMPERYALLGLDREIERLKYGLCQ